MLIYCRIQTFHVWASNGKKRNLLISKFTKMFTENIRFVVRGCLIVHGWSYSLSISLYGLTKGVWYVTKTRQNYTIRYINEMKWLRIVYRKLWKFAASYFFPISLTVFNIHTNLSAIVTKSGGVVITVGKIQIITSRNVRFFKRKIDFIVNRIFFQISVVIWSLERPKRWKENVW